MSLTYTSKKSRRVYTRTFDHDLCRRLYKHGVWTQKTLAELFGVSTSMIQIVLNDKQAAAIYRRTQERNRAHSHDCARCSAPITNAAAYNARHRGVDDSLCGRCRQRLAAPTVRPDTLLCSSCRQWLADDEFPLRRAKNAHARRGRHSQCTLCNAAAKRLWRASRTAYQREEQRDADKRAAS